MMRRRYRIEASSPTLQRFVNTLAAFGRLESFIERVTCNSSQEYYYVVCHTEPKVHEALERQRFTDHMIYT